MLTLKAGDRCLILPGVVPQIVNKICTLLQHYPGPFNVKHFNGTQSVISNCWHICTEDGISTLNDKALLVPAKYLIKLPGVPERTMYVQEESILQRMDQLTMLEKSRKMQEQIRKGEQR